MPSGTAVKGSITIDQERCKGCLFCIEYCPRKSIFLSAKLNMKGYFVAEFTAEMAARAAPRVPQSVLKWP